MNYFGPSREICYTIDVKVLFKLCVRQEKGVDGKKPQAQGQQQWVIQKSSMIATLTRVVSQAK